MIANKTTYDIFSIVRRGTFNDYFEVIEDYDINVIDCKQNLLQEAIAHSQPDIANDLIRRGIDLNHKDGNDATALHYCAEYQDISMASVLLQHNADINAEDKFGNQPLWYAVFEARGKYELVELLMENGANSEHKNRANRSPLNFAKQIEDAELVRILSK